MAAKAPTREIYTVSRLNQEVGQLLSGNFPLIWLEGEISNFALPRSGHMYFSIKDAGSQVRAAMFRNRNMLLRFKPEDGMQVLMRVRVGLYEPRGDYQLVIEHMEEAGDGALRRAFEVLKQKLLAEGLFDESCKRGLPTFPQRLGIITSPTGAAIRDVLIVLRRRYPQLPIIIHPVAVQGARAANEICSALHLAEQRQECDVLLLTRGGGSLEDLDAFNNEQLARAIAASSIPIVCGIGHEIDFTIADFAADLRAPTPSAAAELISPDSEQLRQHVLQYKTALNRSMLQQLQSAEQQRIALERRLYHLHPQRQLNQQAQHLDELENRLQRAMQNKLKEMQNQLLSMHSQLSSYSPKHLIAQYQSATQHVQQRLAQLIQHLLADKKQQAAALFQNLNAVSPLATLQRGYAIVTQASNGKPVMNSNFVTIGEPLTVQLAKGTLAMTVDQIKQKCC